MKLTSPKLRPLKPIRSPKLHLELIHPLVSSTFDKNTQSLLTPSTIAQDSQRSVSYRRKILNFNEFLSNCENLQKDITGLSRSIEKSLTSKPKKEKRFEKSECEIRNQEYFNGIKRIEERIQVKKNLQPKEDLRTLRSLMNPGFHEQFITEADLNSKEGIDFLAENKRSFGKMFKELKDIIERVDQDEIGEKVKKKKKRLKLIDLLKETSCKRLKKKRKSMPCLGKNHEFGDDKGDGAKNKLPVLDLARMIAAKARNDANRLFVDRKLINNRVQVKKRSIFNLNSCKYL